MSRAVKIWMIAAGLLLLIGCLLFGGVVVALKGDLMKLSTHKYDTKVHEISDPYQDITIESKSAKILLLPAVDGKCRVECYEQKNAGYTVSVEDGALVIKLVDNRKWYEYIGFDFTTPTVTVYLPPAAYGALSVESSTGGVEVARELSFGSVDITASTCDVYCYASVTGAVRIKTGTGDIALRDVQVGALDLAVTTGEVSVADVVCADGVTVTVSTGEALLTRLSCKTLISRGSTGDITLKNAVVSELLYVERGTGEVTLTACVADTVSVKTDTGDVELAACDAATVLIETDTGDVEGTLCSPMVVFAQSGTGKIRVPKLTEGGRCEITTDTGDIEIDIVEN